MQRTDKPHIATMNQRTPKNANDITEIVGEETNALALLKNIDWEQDQTIETDLTGTELINAYVKRLPNKPGVYRMFNADGDVLYVGKAKSLKNRVTSYGRHGGHTNRIARMIRETSSMEFVTTRSETEALLLEANLIKRLRPKFNVLLRDDKSFPYILIKRCSGPCTGEISIEGYSQLVKEANDFLSGKSRAVQDSMAKTMQQSSEDLDFERAAMYRDRIAALTAVQSHQGINPQGVEEADVFAIHQEDSSLEPSDVLGAFISQFYDNKPCPRLILLSETIAESELLEAALSLKAERKVTINASQRGEKRDLVMHALSNAKEALGRRLAETSSQAKLMKGLAETFGLSRVPRRIEVFDNSHIQGTNAVGAMIVAGPEGFVKNQYRKFNIRSTEITPGDDFGMMREVMERRWLVKNTAFLIVTMILKT
ncbi:UvrABC system protein C [Nymphon striatum]|nr:UvrABC system protein C [Nymphon striatum]